MNQQIRAAQIMRESYLWRFRKCLARWVFVNFVLQARLMGAVNTPRLLQCEDHSVKSSRRESYLCPEQRSFGHSRIKPKLRASNPKARQKLNARQGPRGYYRYSEIVMFRPMKVQPPASNPLRIQVKLHAGINRDPENLHLLSAN